MYGCVNKERVPRLRTSMLELPTEWAFLKNKKLYLEPFLTDNWSLYIQVLFRQFTCGKLRSNFLARQKLRICQKNVSQHVPVIYSELKNFRIEIKLKLSNDFWEWSKMSQVRQRSADIKTSVGLQLTVLFKMSMVCIQLRWSWCMIKKK